MAFLTYPRVDPVLVTIGPFAIHWYGLAYVAAFIVAWVVLAHLDKRWRLGLDSEGVLDVLLAAIVGLVVGARLGWVLFYGLSVIRTPIDVIAVWDGGMSFHGGLVGLLVAAWVMSRRTGVPFLRLCDVGAVAAPPGLLLGRLANFINGELYGRVTRVPWAMVFPHAGSQPRHPSQLYEAALEGAVLFAVMWALSRRLRPRGELLGWFLALYGSFRVFLELFREPDPQLGPIIGPITMGQLLSVPMIVGGVALIVWARRRGQGGREGRRAEE